ncbi:unnamed protein product [Rotaria sp. Silwood1]|nr:unnamed protein product [Rotaria sp. Silwood1]
MDYNRFLITKKEKKSIIIRFTRINKKSCFILRVLIEQTEPDCVLVLTSTRYFIACYDETFQKVVSFKETPLTSINSIEVGENPLSPPGSSWTLRIHFTKEEQTTGYYHQFRGTNVQVFNTTVMFLKDIEQINDYMRTIGQMIVSIVNAFVEKSLELKEKKLNRINSLPDDVEPFQKRMSFSATDMPPLATISDVKTSNSKATINKIKDFGSRFSSMVSRQAVPTINKLTTQAKQLPINEKVTSLLKVIGESPSLILSGTIKIEGDNDRASPTFENNRKKILQEKFDERKKDLSSIQCQTKCFLLSSPDLTLIYTPNNEQK